MNKKTGIALSGGVDSTATALLLREQFGAEHLHGFFMRLAQPDFAQQLQNVQEIAGRVGIPLTVIDLSEKFSAKVLDYFSASYFCGKTPNPCVVCNREIKFGLFAKEMLARGIDRIATGHYAKIIKDKNDTHYHLFMGKDRSKDQSYFLSRLGQQQLGKILFPLGDMEKEEIYQYVEHHGFTHFRGKESQDVCFLENESVAHFLKNSQKTKTLQGNIIDSAGNKRGEHSGVYNYTVGQRKGLGIAHNRPLYVIALNPQENEVIVGEKEELYRQKIALDKLHWTQGQPPEENQQLLVKIRSTHKGAAATLTVEGDRGTVFFTEAQRAITPGQFAVFYQDEEVLGSGVIQ